MPVNVCQHSRILTTPFLTNSLAMANPFSMKSLVGTTRVEPAAKLTLSRRSRSRQWTFRRRRLVESASTRVGIGSRGVNMPFDLNNLSLWVPFMSAPGPTPSSSSPLSFVKGAKNDERDSSERTNERTQSQRERERERERGARLEVSDGVCGGRNRAERASESE